MHFLELAHFWKDYFIDLSSTWHLGFGIYGDYNGDVDNHIAALQPMVMGSNHGWKPHLHKLNFIMSYPLRPALMPFLLYGFMLSQAIAVTIWYKWCMLVALNIGHFLLFTLIGSGRLFSSFVWRCNAMYNPCKASDTQ